MCFRTIIFCGEVVTTTLLDRCVKALPKVQFANLYSVSEAHDIACSDLSNWYKQEQVCYHLYHSFQIQIIVLNYYVCMSNRG